MKPCTKKWFYLGDRENNPFFSCFLDDHVEQILECENERVIPKIQNITLALKIYQKIYKKPEEMYMAIYNSQIDRNKKTDAQAKSKLVYSDGSIILSDKTIEKTQTPMPNVNLMEAADQMNQSTKKLNIFENSNLQVKNVELCDLPLYPPMTCRECHEGDNDSMVYCDICQSWFHRECEALSKNYYDKIIPTLPEYKCLRCKKNIEIEKKFMEMMYKSDQYLIRMLIDEKIKGGLDEKIKGGNSRRKKTIAYRTNIQKKQQPEKESPSSQGAPDLNKNTKKKQNAKTINSNEKINHLDMESTTWIKKSASQRRTKKVTYQNDIRAGIEQNEKSVEKNHIPSQNFLKELHDLENDQIKIGENIKSESHEQTKFADTERGTAQTLNKNQKLQENNNETSQDSIKNESQKRPVSKDRTTFVKRQKTESSIKQPNSRNEDGRLKSSKDEEKDVKSKNLDSEVEAIEQKDEIGNKNIKAKSNLKGKKTSTTKNYKKAPAKSSKKVNQKAQSVEKTRVSIENDFVADKKNSETVADQTMDKKADIQTNENDREKSTSFEAKSKDKTQEFIDKSEEITLESTVDEPLDVNENVQAVSPIINKEDTAEKTEKLFVEQNGAKVEHMENKCDNNNEKEPPHKEPTTLPAGLIDIEPETNIINPEIDPYSITPPHTPNFKQIEKNNTERIDPLLIDPVNTDQVIISEENEKFRQETDSKKENEKSKESNLSTTPASLKQPVEVINKKVTEDASTVQTDTTAISQEKTASFENEKQENIPALSNNTSIDIINHNETTTISGDIQNEKSQYEQIKPIQKEEISSMPFTKSLFDNSKFEFATTKDTLIQKSNAKLSFSQLPSTNNPKQSKINQDQYGLLLESLAQENSEKLLLGEDMDKSTVKLAQSETPRTEVDRTNDVLQKEEMSEQNSNILNQVPERKEVKINPENKDNIVNEKPVNLGKVECSDIKTPSFNICTFQDREVPSQSIQHRLTIPEQSNNRPEIPLGDDQLTHLNEKGAEITDQNLNEKGTEMTDQNLNEKGTEMTDQNLNEKGTEMSEQNLNEKGIEMAEQNLNEKGTEMADENLNEKGEQFSENNDSKLEEISTKSGTGKSDSKSKKRTPASLINEQIKKRKLDMIVNMESSGSTDYMFDTERTEHSSRQELEFNKMKNRSTISDSKPVSLNKLIDNPNKIVLSVKSHTDWRKSQKMEPKIESKEQLKSQEILFENKKGEKSTKDKKPDYKKESSSSNDNKKVIKQALDKEDKNITDSSDLKQPRISDKKRVRTIFNLKEKQQNLSQRLQRLFLSYETYEPIKKYILNMDFKGPQIPSFTENKNDKKSKYNKKKQNVKEANEKEFFNWYDRQKICRDCGSLGAVIKIEQVFVHSNDHMPVKEKNSKYSVYQFENEKEGSCETESTKDESGLQPFNLCPFCFALTPTLYERPVAGENCGITDGESFFVNEHWWGRKIPMNFGNKSPIKGKSKQTDISDDPQLFFLLERRDGFFFVNNKIISPNKLDELLERLNITHLTTDSVKDLFKTDSPCYKEMIRAISNEGLFNEKKNQFNIFESNIVINYRDIWSGWQQMNQKEKSRRFDEIRQALLLIDSAMHSNSSNQVKNVIKAKNCSEQSSLSLIDSAMHSNSSNQVKNVIKAKNCSDQSSSNIDTPINLLERKEVEHTPSKVIKHRMWCISAQSLFKNPTLSHIFTIKNNPIVSKSFIAGAGLYSERMYDKGEAVLFYDGDQVSKEQGDKLDELYQKAGLFYMFKLDKRFYIDGTVLSDKCKFINHGCNQKKNQRPIQRNNPFLNCESSKLSNFCQSNCQATSILTGSRKKILIQTERIITEGEEFAYDYGKKKVFTCNCEFRGR